MLLFNTIGMTTGEYRQQKSFLADRISKFNETRSNPTPADKRQKLALKL